MSTATPLPIDAEGNEQQQPRSSRGTPTWEIALLFPEQGDWSEEEYLNLDTNHLIEYVDGCLEFLPMPTKTHQFILLFLCDLLRGFVLGRRLGRVLVAPYFDCLTSSRVGCAHHNILCLDRRTYHDI